MFRTKANSQIFSIVDVVIGKEDITPSSDRFDEFHPIVKAQKRPSHLARTVLNPQDYHSFDVLVLQILLTKQSSF